MRAISRRARALACACPILVVRHTLTFTISPSGRESRLNSDAVKLDSFQWTPAAVQERARINHINTEAYVLSLSETLLSGEWRAPKTSCSLIARIPIQKFFYIMKRKSFARILQKRCNDSESLNRGMRVTKSQQVIEVQFMFNTSINL